MIRFEGPIVILLFVLWLLFMAALAIGSIWLIRPWLRALLSGAPVALLTILTMRLRGSPAMLLIDAYGTLRRAGVSTTIREVEETYLDNRTRVRTSQDLVGLVQAKTAAAIAHATKSF